MYTVKAIDPVDRAMTFACGTAEQALDKAQSLASRGFREIYVVEPRGQVRTIAAFERMMDE